jgi:ABC-type multidrug transport system ATPase subunit/pSer/pThr/pTyr-binding forkhead associated (FHA) protein
VVLWGGSKCAASFPLAGRATLFVLFAARLGWTFVAGDRDITASVLEIRNGQEIRRLALASESVAIGRAADNDVVLDDPRVSRHHARIDRRADAYYLIDQGSANGTLLNGAELAPKEPARLKDADAVFIAGFHITFLETHKAGAGAVAEEPRGQLTIGPAGVPPAGPRRLVVTAGGSTSEHTLEKDVLTLGRDASNDIVINDPKVSRRHADLRRVAAGYEIVDAGSANGIRLQGTLISQRLLADGDVLNVGEAALLTYREGVPEEAPSVLDLGDDAHVTIGRNPANTVVLNHPLVASRQIAIVKRGGQIFVEDRGADSQTFVNAKPLGRGEVRPLSPGDVIRVGPTKFIVSEEKLERVDESRELRIDALHLHRAVGQGRDLLQDISLAVEPQEFVAIVGVSGAGKTTLLDALNGFRRATDGRVLVNGEDLYRNFDSYRYLLGYVPQDDTIHKELTVYEALDYAARLRLPSDTSAEEREARITDVMDTLGLAERAQLPIQRLSGGQRKRVCIGTELLTRPGLFYLDEATSGLDPGTESQMMRLLRKLADEGHTILLVTHATKNVMLCDQVVFLAKGGYLAYYGPPEEALAYFGVQDFDAIYEKLDEDVKPEEWGAQYRRSPQHQELVVQRLHSRYGPVVQADAPPKPASDSRPSRGSRTDGARHVSALGQLRILTSRYLRIITRDRINLAMLFGVAPLLGAIDLITWPRHVLDPLAGEATRAMTMLFMAALVPFLVGALSSVREIVKEAPVYRRERTVGLGILPYLLSKVSVGFLFALYHASALLALKLLAVDLGTRGTAGIAEFYATVALAAMSGVMWGLVISTIAPREEQAMIMVIVIVVAQMVFSGGLVALGEIGTAGTILGSITSSKWAFQGLTASLQVKAGDCVNILADCRLPGIQQYATDPERRVYLKPIEDRFGDVFGQDIVFVWVAMAVIIVALFALVYILQRRKDII